MTDPTIPRVEYTPVQPKAPTTEDAIKLLLDDATKRAEEARLKARPRLVRAWAWFAENNWWIAWTLALLLALSTAAATYQWRKAEAEVAAKTSTADDPALQRAIGKNAEKAKTVVKAAKATADGKAVYGTFDEADAALKAAMENAKPKKKDKK